MDTLIKGYCFTNIDEYKFEKWPDEFQCPPRVGDRIAARSKRSLKVIEVTHEYDGVLLIELHK